MTDEQIAEHFLPYDAHWNLAGSDLLGRYVFGILQAGKLALPVTQ
jgi:hypothetical protein